MDRVEHQSRPFTRKPDGTRVYHTHEEPNRKDGRDAGRYRGMIWSQMKRPDRITLGEELYRKAKANAE